MTMSVTNSLVSNRPNRKVMMMRSSRIRVKRRKGSRTKSNKKSVIIISKILTLMSKYKRMPH